MENRWKLLEFWHTNTIKVPKCQVHGLIFQEKSKSNRISAFGKDEKLILYGEPLWRTVRAPYKNRHFSTPF